MYISGMLIKSFAKLDQKKVDQFYDPINFGVIVLRDEAFQKRLITLHASLKHRDFYLKGEQHVHNGQEHYLFDLSDKHVDPALISMLEIYKHVRKPFGSYARPTKMDYGVTKYPKGKVGAGYHVDFSYHVQVTVFFFFGPANFRVALDKEGNGMKEYKLQAGDIVFKRGPRDDTKEERELRSVMGMGEVAETFYTVEIREVDEKRKKKVSSQRK